ncbi:hypothetical protein MYVALT_G_02340 [Candidatus Vallotia tarda]|uniref:Uncharacterized protein n=1 Tax=Candidatus Vallotiella hemipterorum TaxID=1177213 RepID=A0A916JTM7_9BURK|nr:hypothetical protein MYVALT_G_02340 [Candidatus Vallotia tarda]
MQFRKEQACLSAIFIKGIFTIADIQHIAKFYSILTDLVSV